MADYFREHAVDLEITNLLDDGILRFFAREREPDAEARLAELLCAARDAYDAELAMITCSAVTRQMLRRLADATDLPIVKIDDALARQVVLGGSRIGVVVTFRPTQSVISKLLRDTAQENGRQVDLTIKLIPDAHEALLGGNLEKHDELLLAGISELGKEPLDEIVLAQVSMTRVLSKLPGLGLKMPVLSSLPAGLATIREKLATLGTKA